MIAEQYRTMLETKSVIRTLSEIAASRAKEIGSENVFDYSLGNPSVPAPPQFTENLIRLIQENDPVSLHGYSPTLGIPSVKKKLADYLNDRYGARYTPAHIFPASAAAGAIAHALRAVTAPGDEVLAIAPYFPEYGPYVNMTGAVLKVVPPDFPDFQINFSALSRMVTDKTAAMLINTPNNPSGAVYSADTLGMLAAILTDKGRRFGHPIYLISDEPYREIVYDGKTQFHVPNFYKNTISCYSFSKSLSIPGERIGYMAVSPDCPDAEMIVNICGQISRGIGHNCPSSLMQLAVAETLGQTADFSIYERNRDLLYDCLTELGFTVTKPKGAFYIFPKALEEDAVAFCQKALDYDLVLVPGDSFGCPGYFRMAYCMDTEKVERSLPVLRRFVREVYRA